MTEPEDAVALPAASAPPLRSLWWHQPFQMFQTNLREVDAGLDVERTLDRIEAFGANAWLLNVGGIIANYPSRLPSQTLNPRLSERASGDLVGDAVTAAHGRGIRLLARMDFSKVDHRRAEQHPEWCFVGPNGARQVYNGLTSVCPSASYYQDHSFGVVDEVLDRYDVDGFFLNWLSYNEVDYSGTYRGVCHCRACSVAFAVWCARSGGSAGAVPGLPAGPEDPGYVEWQRFAQAMISNYGARMRALIAARRPEAPLILGDSSDIAFHEANNQVGRPLWHYRTSENVSAAKATRPERPVLTNAVSFVDMPYRWAGEEPHHMAQHLAQAIARGANPSTYVMGTPAVGQYECLETASRITRHHRDNRDVYAGLHSTARVLLVRPDPLDGRGGSVQRRMEFEGVYISLQERHIPFDVLPEEELRDTSSTGSARQSPGGRLARYALVILPDMGSLSRCALRVLNVFTANGGALMTTGSTDMSTERTGLAGSPVDHSPAALEGDEATRSLHLRPGSGSEFLLPVIGSYYVVAPDEGAHTRMTLLSRAPYGPPEKCYGHIELDHPGYLVAKGQGRSVAVIPWTVGRAFREVGLSAHRDLLVDVAMEVAREPIAARTDLPDQIEVIAGRSDQGDVVHLLNMSGVAPQRFGAPVPVSGSRFWLPWLSDGLRVHALVAGIDLPVCRSAHGPFVDLPTIGVFEVLVLREKC